MRDKFLLSVFIAIILPILVISFFAGASVLIAFIRWFALVILIGIIIFYFLGAGAKTAVSKMGVFENGLWLSSLILKFIAFLDLIFSLVAVIFAYMILNESLGKNFTVETSFGRLIIFSAGAFPALAIFALLASLKLYKQSKLSYFLALPISFLHIFVLVGIYPTWFLMRYRKEYFFKGEYGAN